MPKRYVPLREGHHEAAISHEMLMKIQDRIAGNTHAPARKDLNADFPLRSGMVWGDVARR